MKSTLHLIHSVNLVHKLSSLSINIWRLRFVEHIVFYIQKKKFNRFIRCIIIADSAFPKFFNAFSDFELLLYSHALSGEACFYNVAIEKSLTKTDVT